MNRTDPAAVAAVAGVGVALIVIGELTDRTPIAYLGIGIELGAIVATGIWAWRR